MITFDQIKHRLSMLKRAELTLVASGSGVPVDTLIKIWNGQTKNPGISTVEKLIYYYERKAA